MTSRKSEQGRARLLVVALLLMVAGAALAVVLSRSKAGPVPECARYVPHDSAFLIMVPSIREAMLQQNKLTARLKKNEVVGALWEQLGGSVVKELGFDPGKPETIKVVGVDPRGGLVAAMSADGKSTMAALAVVDQAAMEKTLRGLVRRTVSAPRFQARTVGGVKLTLVTDQALAWGYHGSCVVISFGSATDKPADHVAALMAQQKHIGGDRTFLNMLGKVRGQQVVMYVNGAPLGRRYRAHQKRLNELLPKHGSGQAQDVPVDLSSYFTGAVVGLGVSGRRVDLKAHVGIPPQKVQQLTKLLRGTGKAAPLGKYILPGAVLAARGSIDLRAVLDGMEAQLPPEARQQYRAGVALFEQRTGIKEKDLHDLLAGRYGIGVFAPSSAAMAGDGTLQDRLARAAGGVVLIQTRGKDKAAAVLERLARAWRERGAAVLAVPGSKGKRYCYQRQGQCVVSWATARDMVVVASSRHMEASLKLVEEGGKSLLERIKGSHARSTFRKDDGMILYLDLYQVATLARKMTLPGIFMMTYKMYVQPAAALLAMFSDLALTAEPAPDGIIARLVITLK